MPSVEYWLGDDTGDEKVEVDCDGVQVIIDQETDRSVLISRGSQP